MLKRLEEFLQNNDAPLPIFNKQFFNGEYILSLDRKENKVISDFQKKSFKEKEEILSKYWVFPNYSDTQIDEEYFKEQYHGFFKPLENE